MAGQGFRDELTQLLQARYPLLVVETHEEQRVIREIRAVAEDQQRLRTPRRVYVWSSTTGLAPAGGPPISETRAASAALERVYGWGEPAVFVFVDLHPPTGLRGRAPAGSGGRAAGCGRSPPRSRRGRCRSV